MIVGPVRRRQWVFDHQAEVLGHVVGSGRLDLVGADKRPVDPAAPGCRRTPSFSKEPPERHANGYAQDDYAQEHPQQLARVGKAARGAGRWPFAQEIP